MSFVPRVITHNASLKGLALAGAVVLWAIVPGAPQGGEILADVPVRVQVADLGWVLSAQPDPNRVQVRVSGPTREIIRLAREGTVVRVPVENVVGSDTVVTLRRDWVSLAGSPGVVVEEVVPGSVRLQLEEARSESLRFTLPTVGELPGDLALAAELGLSARTAWVRGPVRLVEAVESIPLMPLDLSRIQRSGFVEVAVDTTGLSGLLVDPMQVSVGIRVEPAVERRLSGLTIRVERPPAYTVVVEPATADLRVSGAEGRLAAAPLGSARLVVDGRLLRGMAPGESRTVPLTVTGLPAWVAGAPVRDSVSVVRPVDQGAPR